MARQGGLAGQAALYAGAAVPTVGSINSQFNQSQGDVHNFTGALIRLLQAGGDSDPYASAVNSQQAANAAAVQRLTNLASPNAAGSAMVGNPYAAGSAAAVGGMGDSALGSLNQQRGAAIQYQRQLPGIAAARGELANSSLTSARHTALEQRDQQFQSAYMQALQQLRDYGLQKTQIQNQARQFNQTLQQQNQQFAANQAYQYASLNQRSAEFKSSQGQQWREFLVQQAASVGGTATHPGPSGSLAGFTTLQIHNMLGEASTQANNAATKGIGPQEFIRTATHLHNVPAPIAFIAVKRIYGSAPKNSPAYKAYVAWVKRRLWVDQVSAGPKNQRNPNPPGR